MKSDVRQLDELTAARGFAALAVVIYHTDAYCGDPLGSLIPMVAVGRLPVDFFFVLSGFVLTHVYRASWLAGSYSHRDFLVRRIARIWPLHVACLLGVAAIVLVGSRFGFAPPWRPSEWSFLAHATMLHATGLSPDKAWNQPSWSVSAEWTAYLAFPVYLVVTGWFRTPAAKLGAAALLFAGLWGAARFLAGVDLLALMNDGGMWRIIPSFFAGVALREILDSGLGSSLRARPLGALLLATLALIAAALLLGATTALVWPALPALVYLLALRARSPEGGLMRSRPLIWMGDVSYALYLVHAPVLMVAFGLGAKLGGVSGSSALVGLGAIAIIASIAAAAVAHYAIERPAQSFIVDRFARHRAPARTAATLG